MAEKLDLLLVLLCFGTSSCSRNRPVKFVGGKKELPITTLAVFRDLVERVRCERGAADTGPHVG